MELFLNAYAPGTQHHLSPTPRLVKVYFLTVLVLEMYDMSEFYFFFLPFSSVFLQCTVNQINDSSM